ncbi:MAG: hypothetical protein M3O30_17360 [Planctomycetota bacterium]|nr:hypothetical protein [Planctomycetota bacterium]
MSTPLLKERRVLAAKTEVTWGTPIALTSGTDGVINAYDVMVDGDIQPNKRVAAGAFGRLASNVGAYSGTAKFKVEAVGSGTPGTPPAWATVLLPACGMVNTAGTFTPVSAASAQSAITLANLSDGSRKMLAGSMGKWSYNGQDGEISYFEFEFKGVWQPVTDVAMFTPQFSTVIPPRFAGVSLTLGAYSPIFSKLTLDYGNVVDLRQNADAGSGYQSAVIVGRETTGSIDPEQTLVANYDAFGAWLAGTTAAMSFTIGSGGTGFTINVPVTQYEDIKEGDRNKKVTSQIKFGAKQNGSTPDSEISIVF